MPNRPGPKSRWDTQHAWKSTTHEPNWTTIKTTIKGHFHEIYDVDEVYEKNRSLLSSMSEENLAPDFSGRVRILREISGRYPGNDHIYRRSPPENSNDRDHTNLRVCLNIYLLRMAILVGKGTDRSNTTHHVEEFDTDVNPAVTGGSRYLSNSSSLLKQRRVSWNKVRINSSNPSMARLCGNGTEWSITAKNSTPTLILLLRRSRCLFVNTSSIKRFESDVKWGAPIWVMGIWRICVELEPTDQNRRKIMTRRLHNQYTLIPSAWIPPHIKTGKQLSAIWVSMKWVGCGGSVWKPDEMTNSKSQLRYDYKQCTPIPWRVL